MSDVLRLVEYAHHNVTVLQRIRGFAGWHPYRLGIGWGLDLVADATPEWLASLFLVRVPVEGMPIVAEVRQECVMRVWGDRFLLATRRSKSFPLDHQTSGVREVVLRDGPGLYALTPSNDIRRIPRLDPAALAASS